MHLQLVQKLLQLEDDLLQLENTLLQLYKKRTPATGKTTPEHERSERKNLLLWDCIVLSILTSLSTINTFINDGHERLEDVRPSDHFRLRFVPKIDNERVDLPGRTWEELRNERKYIGSDRSWSRKSQQKLGSVFGKTVILSDQHESGEATDL